MAHVFAFWESRAFYDSFMARSHDRLASAQAGTFKDAQVRLFDHRFDVKTGFEPRFTDADLLRVALCRVHEERAEHYVLMQEKVWNPAMAGSPGMIRGLFGEAPGDAYNEYLVLSMWLSAAEHGKYRTERIERLALRARTEADIAALTGVDLGQLAGVDLLRPIGPAEAPAPGTPSGRWVQVTPGDVQALTVTDDRLPRLDESRPTAVLLPRDVSE